MSGPLVVFDLLIPRTDDRTGVVHPPSLFDQWTVETAERFPVSRRLPSHLDRRARRGESLSRIAQMRCRIEEGTLTASARSRPPRSAGSLLTRRIRS